jgi:hypothetical protein
MARLLLLGLVLGLAASASVSARTWYINPDGTGDAPTVQAAIDLAYSGDVVQLAPGEYTWANQGSGDSQGLVHMRSGLVLLGEPSVPQSVVLDARGLGRVIYGPEAVNCTYSGLTITGGDARLGSGSGGGLACGDDSRLISCRFVRNSAMRGGAVLVSGSGVEMVDCLFSENGCDIEGGAVYGSPRVIRGCTFEFNSTAHTSGGIYSPVGIDSVVACIFDRNWNQPLMVMSGALNVRQCEFRGNGGGGLWLYTVTADISQCVFTGFYGGVHLEGAAHFRVHECTIAGNAGEGVRIRYGWLQLENCIVANNGGYFISNSQLPADPVFICCDVYGNREPGWNDYWHKFDGVSGNFSACPSFCRMEAGDYHLCDDSPCLPGNHPYGCNCGLIGARGLGCSCGPSGIEPSTWGSIKAQ